MLLSVWALLLRGVATTMEVAACAFVVAAPLGFAFALVKVFGRLKPATILIDAYVEIFRNMPALAHLFILYFGLASIGLPLSSFAAATLGLGLIGAATLTDVFRAGFQSLHAGQREAALAVGMTPAVALRFILGPQVLRIALPPLANYAAQLVKDTSIIAAIAAPEIMFYARSLVTSTFATTLIYVSAAALYLAMSLPLSFLAERLERSLGGAR